MKHCIFIALVFHSSDFPISPTLRAIFCNNALFLLERFSIECRKTKTKVTNLANHKGHRQSSEPIKIRNTCNRREARENACEQASNGFTADWLRKWREMFKLCRLITVVIQNHAQVKRHLKHGPQTNQEFLYTPIPELDNL